MILKNCPQGHFYDAESNTECPVCKREAGFTDPMTTCPQGHRYNRGIYLSCPECAAQEPSRELFYGGSQLSVNVDGFSVPPIPGDTLAGIPAYDLMDEKNRDMANRNKKEHLLYRSQITQEARDLVAGWLVCTQGRFRGCSFELYPRHNTLGREEGDICLVRENQVSRRDHLFLEYHEERFWLVMAQGRNLVYLNGNPVFAPQPLKKGDEITVGDTTLRFEPLDYRW